MAKPIAPKKSVALAFPDVCKTPAPPGPPVPIPYPNIAQLDQASPATDEGGKELLVAGTHVLTKASVVSHTSGDEAGSVGGVKSGGIKGKCEMTQSSESVVYGPNSDGIVRFLDQTQQNDGNAQGVVLSADPTVFVGD